LPIDTLVFSPGAQYIYLARDPRDVVWSAYNHLIAFPDIVWKSGYPGRRPEGEERDHYLDFLAGNCDPMPTFGEYWDHVRGWWAFRHLPNVLFVHYANLKADLAGQIRSIARFLDIPLDESLMPKILKHCGIDYMRDIAVQRVASLPGASDFQTKFFNKGTNGRWKDVLTPAEIAMADEAAARYLMPDCAHWLKTGELPEGKK
jgi:aryl sulfotransferase